MEERNKALSRYRMDTASETLIVAEECYNGMHYKDSVNRSYYAAFYAAREIVCAVSRYLEKGCIQE